MVAEVYSEMTDVYFAFCGECGWDGHNYLDEGDAQYEAARHNESCDNGVQPDTRTERQRFQEALDHAYQNAKGAFA